MNKKENSDSAISTWQIWQPRRKEELATLMRTMIQRNMKTKQTWMSKNVKTV